MDGWIIKEEKQHHPFKAKGQTRKIILCCPYTWSEVLYIAGFLLSFAFILIFNVMSATCLPILWDWSVPSTLHVLFTLQINLRQFFSQYTSLWAEGGMSTVVCFVKWSKAVVMKMVCSAGLWPVCHYLTVWGEVGFTLIIRRFDL